MKVQMGLKRTLSLLATALYASTTFAAATITGAGATFPYPLYAKWADTYKTSTGMGINYQSIGSGGGIKQIEAKTVDFGASDKPLTAAELEKSGLVQFPTVMGGVVPVMNIPGVSTGQLKLSGTLLADIFLGKIKKWNDPALLSLNPGLTLPDQAIVVVRRSDGSGTTFVFTHYLSEISADWKSRVGENTSVNWPTGVGGKGNEGVANYVTRIKGAIGYVEYAYAKETKIAYAAMQNREGNMVLPSKQSFEAAAANANWKAADGFYQILTNQVGKESWPMTAATFILMHKKPTNAAQSAEALKFFEWAYQKGDQDAIAMNYVPMPAAVKKLIRESWNGITDPQGKTVLR